MKALALEVTADPGPALNARATVRLTPHWLARLFGARVELVDLVATECWYDGDVKWRSATTGRTLRDMPLGELIREALERRPAGELPAAIARRGA